jgi:hypothetical protein
MKMMPQWLKKMIEGKIEKIKSLRGDGAYDDFSLREKLGASIEQIIPPPKDAVIHYGTKKKPLPDYLIQRNQAVESINKIGRKEWKINSGYHERSLNETVMFRYKTSFGGEMSARKLEHQKTEMNIKCHILNTYRRQGIPIAYKVAIELEVRDYFPYCLLTPPYVPFGMRRFVKRMESV